MSEQPLISVIMPVFNAELYIKEAIESVLNQTYKNIELICVNDGSTDNALGVLKSFSDKIIIIDSKENCGISITRNKGVKVARGEFIAFMDCDDIWKENKLELQMDEFEKDPCLEICFGYMQCFISPELPEEIKKIRYCPPEPMAGYIPPAMLVKTKSFLKVGYFDPKWRMGEFIDWYDQAKEMNLKSTIIKQIVYLRRIHTTNTGVISRGNRIDYLKIARESINRKRSKK